MKKFATLYYAVGKPVLGSDGHIPLDGRLNIGKCIHQVREKIKSLSAVKSGITYFEIRRGDLRRSVVIASRDIPFLG